MVGAYTQPPYLRHSIQLISYNNRNLALSLAAGNATIWKPSPTTPLCSIAITTIISRVLERNGVPGAVASLVTGGKEVGEAIVENQDVPLGKICERPLGCPKNSIDSLLHWK